MKTFFYSTITFLAVVGCLVAFPREKPSLERHPVSVQTTTVPTRKDVKTIIRNKKNCKCCKSSLIRSLRQRTIKKERKSQFVKEINSAS